MYRNRRLDEIVALERAPDTVPNVGLDLHDPSTSIGAYALHAQIPSDRDALVMAYMDVRVSKVIERRMHDHDEKYSLLGIRASHPPT